MTEAVASGSGLRNWIERPMTAGRIRVAAATMAAVVLATDRMLELGVAGGVPYVAVVLLSLQLPKREVYFAALACSLLVVAGFFVSPLGGELWKVISNRALALFAIWVATLLGLSAKRSERAAVELRSQRAVDDATRASHRRMAAIFESTSDAMFLLDGEAGVVDANPMACKLLGRRRGEVLDTSALNFGLSCSDEVRLKRWKAFLARGEASGQFLLARENAAECEIEYQAVASIEPGLNLVVLRDVTARVQAEAKQRQLERQLLHSQKLESLGVLAGGIAHDFNNLLVGVLGYAELARGELPPDAPALEHIRQVEVAADCARELTRQLLAYSGSGKFEVAVLNLSALTGEMAQLLHTAVSKQVELRFELSDQSPLVEADPAQLRQVVMNLITNASEAIGDRPGIISLRTGIVKLSDTTPAALWHSRDLAEGAYVFAEVSDTGVGIAAGKIERIFDPFYSTKGAGRGLGLAATLGIAHGNGGVIQVDSEPEKGTTIRLLLPVSDQPETSADSELRRSERSGQWQGEATILVVDDEPQIRAVAKRLLERAGFEVVAVVDGQAAVDFQREHSDQIDAVLLDVSMPRMSGAETFRALRRVQPGLGILLMSGYDEHETTRKLGEEGLAGFIQKPFNGSALVHKMRNLLERRSLC